jgi:GxxExxY protein
VGIPVVYEDIKLDLGFRADTIIGDKVILELKSVENILPVHKKQLLTYLKLTGLRLGLLINFNVELIKNGITRIGCRHAWPERTGCLKRDKKRKP